MNQLSFGTDPELMLINGDGRYISAIPIVKSSKDDRLDLSDGYKMFYDNVLVEFNIPPSYSEEDLVENLRRCFVLANRFFRNSVHLVPQASQMYSPTECVHEDALVFGCEPEYCAYEMSQLNPPTCEPGNTFRSAGGHIHLGYNEEIYPLLAPITEEDRSERDWGRIWVVRMMDLFVGLPSLLIDHDPTSKARRALYGKCGTHRPKEQYGVEYRATSNFWLHSPNLARLVFNLAKFAVDFVGKRQHLTLWKDESKCTKYDVQVLRETIDTSDLRMARVLMEEVVKPILPNNLYVDIFKMSEPCRYNFYREWDL